MDITSTPSVGPRWASLSGRYRAGDDEPAVVLLHGLTFDHRMWGPVIDALPEGRRAIAFDLPGHGDSPMLDEPGLEPVVEAVHAAIVDAGIVRPVVVGHSIGGPIASIYASEHSVSAVVTVEAPLRLETFVPGLLEAAPYLRGPGFEEAWSGFRSSFGLDIVPGDRRPLLGAGDRASQRVVLSYQADLLDRPLDDVVRWRDEGTERLARSGTPYVSLHANPLDPAEVRWLRERLPQAEVLVWPVRHHFPHLERPEEFAGLMTRLARMPG